MGGEKVIAISESIEALVEKTRLIVKIRDKRFLLYEES